MKTICICEKPSVARSIARVLGATEKQEGYLSGNGYAVTWTYGHLLALALPQDYGIVRAEKEMLPIIPHSFKLVVRQVKTEEGHKADPSALKQLDVIRKLLNQAGSVIIWRGTYSQICSWISGVHERNQTSVDILAHGKINTGRF